MPPMTLRLIAPVMLPPKVWLPAFMFVTNVLAAVEVIVPAPPGNVPGPTKYPTLKFLPLRSKVAPGLMLRYWAEVLVLQGKSTLSAPSVSLPSRIVVVPVA